MQARITVRTERPCDSAIVAQIVQRAYANVAYSNHREHLMVDRLRRTDAYVSLLAEIDAVAVGHLLLTRAFIRNEHAEGSARR